MVEKRADQLEAGRVVLDRLGSRAIRRRHGVHVHRCIQRRAAGRIGEIRIRAFLQQRIGDVEVAVDDRVDERRDAVLIRGVDVGLQRREHVDALDAALAAGEVQRREPARRQPFLARLGSDLALPLLNRRSRVDVGAVRRQLADDVGMSFGCSPHQRRLSAPAFARVNDGPAGDEHLHGVEMSRPGSRHQRGLALGGRVVGAGSGFQQLVDDRCVAVERGEIERRDAVPIRGLHIRTGLDQPVDRRRIVLPHGPEQWSCAGRIGFHRRIVRPKVEGAGGECDREQDCRAH